MSQENIEKLDRLQKCFIKLIFPKKYRSENENSYKESLLKVNLHTLEERRETLSLKFAKDCIKYNKLKDLFPENSKDHCMQTRHQEKYKVLHANTDRLKTSSIIQMQNLLNKEHMQMKK